jgi:hypothetical protein
MEDNKYVIVNRKVIQKRIEELKNDEDSKSDISEEEILEDILSNSIPLEQEIEKVFDEARKLKTFNLEDIPLKVECGYKIEKQDYLTQLKLDI